MLPYAAFDICFKIPFEYNGSADLKGIAMQIFRRGC